MVLGLDQQSSAKSKASLQLAVGGRKEISQQHKALDVGRHAMNNF
jgi:hypothetical protein